MGMMMGREFYFSPSLKFLNKRFNNALKFLKKSRRIVRDTNHS